MLYTRKGDDGTTGLFGSKKRCQKNSPLYEALGTVDELCSLLGIYRSKCVTKKDEINVASEILKCQEDLFLIQAELAGAPKSIKQIQIDNIEHVIKVIENRIENPHAFVIPGTTELSAICDYARAVSRKAERAILAAQETKKVSPLTLAYINRLSSFLYALARYEAAKSKIKEPNPTY